MMIQTSHLADEWSCAGMNWHVSGQVVVGIELFPALGTDERFRRSLLVVARLVVAGCRSCSRRRCCRRPRTGRTLFRVPRVAFHLKQRLDQRPATIARRPTGDAADEIVFQTARDNRRLRERKFLKQILCYT